MLLPLLISLISLCAPPRHHSHRDISHKRVNYNHLRQEKFNTEVLVDLATQSLSVTEAYTFKKLYTSLSFSHDLLSDSHFTIDGGWSNDKWDIGIEIDNLLIEHHIYNQTGIRIQHTFQPQEKFSYLVYAYPKFNYEHQLELEESIGEIYQWKHNLSLVIGVSFTPFQPHAEVGILKIF